MRTKGRLIAALAATATAAACIACRPSSEIDRFAIPGRPSAVATTDELVWVSDDERHAVHVLNATTGEAVDRPVEVERNPVAIAAGTGAVWVGHASGTVVRIDAGTRRPGRPIEAGESITGIAVSHGRVWVTDIATDSLVEIDARSSRVLATHTIPDGAVRVAPAGDALWVSNKERTVTRFDPESGRTGPRVNVGFGPIGLAFDGEHIWVANTDDATVSRIDVSTGERVGEAVAVGRGPVAVAVAGGSVWVASQDARTLTRIDPGEARVVGEPIDVGLGPRGVAAGSGAVWVAGTNPSAVVRVDL